MKSWSVTIQKKALQYQFRLVLFFFQISSSDIFSKFDTFVRDR